MTGITYIESPNGDKTHIVLDLGLYGKALQKFLEDLEDIETIKKTEGEEMLTLSEAIDELAKQGKVSKKDLQKMANELLPCWYQ